jgi:riboflavin kinase/FMN adenylyltransferase
MGGMEIYSGSGNLPVAERGSVLTIGNFDGLHLGHQALVNAVVERASELGRAAAVYTFDPHPRRVLQPERDQPLLMTWPQLEAGIADLGVDLLIREPFTPEFASLGAQEFLTGIIYERMAPTELFVGRDFHFGKGRGGSGDTLAQVGPELGMRVTIIPQVRAGGGDVSSTRIREALAGGRVEEAECCLGRPYEIWGKVVRGEARGRQLGFPTANIETRNEILPGNGVYATSVRLFDGSTPHAERLPAVTNVGARPTFDAGRVLAEAHLLDFDGDLYGRRLSIAFHARIRAEQRFPSPEALVRQIRKDLVSARQLLSAEHG